jgi:hypothetical protein
VQHNFLLLNYLAPNIFIIYSGWVRHDKDILCEVRTAGVSYGQGGGCSSLFPPQPLPLKEKGLCAVIFGSFSSIRGENMVLCSREPEFYGSHPEA